MYEFFDVTPWTEEGLALWNAYKADHPGIREPFVHFIASRTASSAGTIYRGVPLQLGPDEARELYLAMCDDLTKAAAVAVELVRRGPGGSANSDWGLGSHWTFKREVAETFGMIDSGGEDCIVYNGAKWTLFPVMFEAEYTSDQVEYDPKVLEQTQVHGYGWESGGFRDEAELTLKRGATVTIKAVTMLVPTKPDVVRAALADGTFQVVPGKFRTVRLSLQTTAAGEWDMSSGEPVWVQPHEELLVDALQKWKGDPINVPIGYELAGEPTPSSGSGKIMRAQARALIQEMRTKARPNTKTLYRGANRPPAGYAPFSEKRSIANYWAKKSGGQVWVLPKGAGMGLRIADYINSGYNDEEEWIIDMDRSTLQVEAKLANAVEDRYGTPANVVGSPGQGNRIFYNRDTDTLIFTNELGPAGGPKLDFGGSANGAFIAYENGELSPGSGAMAPTSQTVYNPLFIEALERLVDTFPEFGRKPLYEASTGGKYNTPDRIGSVWDFLRSVNEMRYEYATQHGAKLGAQTWSTESVYDTETYRLRQHAKIMNLEECGALARTILTDAGFPHGDEAYAVPHPSGDNTSSVAWSMDGYAVPLVALGYNMRDDLTVVHECAHIIRNGPSYAGRQGDMTIAHDDEWFNTFHRLLVRYTHPKLWRSFEFEFGLKPNSGKEASSGTVRLWRGLQVGDADDAELEAIRRDPAGYARKYLSEPLGIHWTDDFSSAYNFALGRDADGWASESWGDDEDGGVWSIGLVIEAEVPSSGVIGRGTQEHDDYSMSDAIIDYSIEREVTVRDGTMVQLTSVTVVASNDDGSDVDFHAGLGMTKRATADGKTIRRGVVLSLSASQVSPEQARRLVDGSVSANDILRLFDNGRVGEWWFLDHHADLVDVQLNYADVDDQDPLADALESYERSRNDPDWWYHHMGFADAADWFAKHNLPLPPKDQIYSEPEWFGGDIGVVLEGRTPTINGQVWDPDLFNPDLRLMGNSYMPVGQRVELIAVHYNTGKGWRSLPASGLSVTTSLAPKVAWNTNGITLYHGTIAYYADRVLAEGLKPRNATGVTNHWDEAAASYEDQVYLSHSSRMTVSRSAMQKARKTVMEVLYPELGEIDQQLHNTYSEDKRSELYKRHADLERQALADPRLESVILAVTIPPSAWGNLRPDEDTSDFTKPTTEMTGFPEWMSSLGSDAVVAYRGEIPASWIKVQARGAEANTAGMYMPEGSDWRR